LNSTPKKSDPNASLKSAAETLNRVLRKHVRWGDRRKLFDAVDELRSWMGPNRSRRPKGYMSHAETLGSYLAYYFPLHLGETYWIFEQHPTAVDFSEIDEVWDLGAGPGTAAVSLLLWLKARGKKIPQNWTLIDSSQRALEIAEEMLTALDPTIRVQRIRANVLTPEALKKFKSPTKKSRFYIASHFLNELGSGPRRRGEKMRLMSLLQGTVLIVEPPLREPTLDLMNLRDDLCDGELDYPAQILAPCPRSHGLCPMLQRSMGWCYAQPPRSWLKSVGLNQWETDLRDISGTHLQDFGFSYLLYTNRQDLGDLAPRSHRVQISDTRNIKTLLCEGNQIVSKAVDSGFRGFIHPRDPQP